MQHLKWIVSICYDRRRAHEIIEIGKKSARRAPWKLAREAGALYFLHLGAGGAYGLIARNAAPEAQKEP